MRRKAVLILVFLAGLGPTLLAADCNSFKARLEMTQGKLYFRKAQFPEAIVHFKAATDSDNNCIAAKFALAGTYASEVIPGIDTLENQHNADQAVAIFLDILQRNPQDLNALKDIGITYSFVRRNVQAIEYFKKAVAVAPNDPDVYYLIGVIDWTIAYRDILKRKQEHDLDMDEGFESTRKSLQLCKEIQAANEARVDDGLAMLRKAMDLKKDYDDAIAYTSLLYELKAAMDCSKQTRSEHLRLAQQWMKKRKTTSAQSSEEQQDAPEDLETGVLWFTTHLLPPPPPPRPMQNRLHAVPR